MTTADDPFPGIRTTEDDLERIRQEIGSIRRRREQAVADFEKFLRESRGAMEWRDSSGEAAGTVRTHSGKSGRAAASIAPQAAASTAPDGPARSSGHSGADFGLFDEADMGRRLRWPRPARREVRLGVTVLAGVVVVAMLVYASGFGGGEPAGPQETPVSEPAAPPSPAPAPAETPPAATEPAATPAASAEASPDARALRIELLTTDEVWLRVVADGDRVLEREVPAGQRLHYAADRSIVVRAGNAGAVRVVAADGSEEPLGREGVAVTRTFSAPVR